MRSYLMKFFLKQTAKESAAFIVVTEQAVNDYDKYYEPNAAVIVIIAVAILYTLVIAFLSAAFHASEIISHIKTSVFFIIL